ncbi:MAG: KTSC domain-containing protein [Nitrosopumilus sp.]
MEMQTIDSSLIASIGYHEEEELMLVVFRTRPAIYGYEGVSRDTYDEVLNADSVGKTFYSLIRDHYAFHIVESLEEEELNAFNGETA